MLEAIYICRVFKLEKRKKKQQQRSAYMVSEKGQNETALKTVSKYPSLCPPIIYIFDAVPYPLEPQKISIYLSLILS